MIAANLADMAVVWVAFGLVYTLPTWVVARRISRGAWTETLLWAWVLGLSSQAVLGVFWSRFAGGLPGVEAAVWLGVWAALSLAFCDAPAPGGGIGRPVTAGVLLTLAIGVSLRSVYPLSHWALGQSDAYSHLQFLHDIVARGYIRNAVYPPGYHWVLGLPTQLLQLDPYIVARYVGAFFGALLILGVTVLGAEGTTPSAGLMGGFLVACFPGFVLLAKTGVGAFANQFGLGLLPPLFLAYSRLADEPARRRAGAGLCLAVATAGMAASVPMMTLSIALVGAFERLVSLARARVGFGQTTARLALAVLPAVLVLLVLFGTADTRRFDSTVGHVVDTDRAKAVIESAEGVPDLKRAHAHGLQILAADFFAVKRVGLGSPAANGCCLALLAWFAVLAWDGLRRGSTARFWLGAWGGLCVVQTATGFLEFFRYQRAGWSLLIALGWSGAAAYATVEGWAARRRWFVPLVIGACAGVAVVAFRFPPLHRHTMSTAEDTLVQTVRGLVQRMDRQAGRRAGLSFARAGLPDLLEAAADAGGIRVVTRSFVGFRGAQGDPVSALAAGTPGLRHKVVYGVTPPLLRMTPGVTHVFLLDDAPDAAPSGGGVAARLNPKVAAKMARWEAGRYRVNEALRRHLDGLEREGWLVRRMRVDGLEMVVANAPSGTGSRESPASGLSP